LFPTPFTITSAARSSERVLLCWRASRPASRCSGSDFSLETQLNGVSPGDATAWRRAWPIVKVRMHDLRLEAVKLDRPNVGTRDTILATDRYGKLLSTGVCNYTVLGLYVPSRRGRPRPTRNDPPEPDCASRLFNASTRGRALVALKPSFDVAGQLFCRPHPPRSCSPL
jgi:hypothetical protein